MLATLVLVLVVVSHDPTPARAGLFGGNSQQVGLQPAPSRRSTASTGGGDISIVGSSALLPDAGPAGTAADISEPVGDQISIYVVRKGDTLGGIAKMFNVSPNTIAWANDLSAKAPLSENQVLIILPVSGVRHTVLKGETLESIAKKYKGDVTEIVQFNNLEDKQLAVGDTVIIPDGEETPPPPPPKKLSQSEAANKKYKLQGTNVPNYSGYFIRPLVGGVKTQGLHGYNGVDLANVIGTPIIAAASGEVIRAKSDGWNGGYGKYIVVSHPNGTQTLYAHLSRVDVSLGEHVEQGEQIGALGSSGNSTGPHIHFEIRGAKNPF